MKLPKDSTINSFVLMLFQNYPKRSILVTCTLVVAAILEIFSLAAILPAILSFSGNNTQSSFISSLLPNMSLTHQIGLIGTMIIVCVFMTIRGFFIFLSHYQIGLIAIDLEQNLRQRLLQDHLLSSWAYQSKCNIGHFVNVITQQTTLCSMAVFQFGHYFIATVTAAILLLTSFYISWKAFLIFAISCFPYLLISKYLNQSTHKASKLYNHTLGECSTEVIEATNLAKYFKASGQESVAIMRFVEKAKDLHKSHKKLIRNKASLFAYPEVFGIITLTGLIILVYYMGALQADSLLFFLLIMYRAYTQISRRQTSKNTLIRQIPSFKKVREQIEQSADAFEYTHTGHTLTNGEEYTLAVQNLSFNYENKAAILKNININIPKNSFIALVGKSGSGKSSLIDCITYINPPVEGRVLLNGTDVTEYDLHAYRALFAYVPQDNFLFSGTIAENILILAQNQTEENLRRAAELANIADFIQTLEHGYNTKIDGATTPLSGGQKQRIALARAIAQEPRFLILDEATSALDNETDAAIQSSLSRIKETTTVIMIAHKLSSVKNADMIYVLEDGHIIESGKFEPLMEKQGAFTKLYKLGETQ